MQSTQKLYRRFNLGDIYKVDDIDDLVNEEALFQSGDILGDERANILEEGQLINDGLAGQDLLDALALKHDDMLIEDDIEKDELMMGLGEEDEDMFINDDDD
jgi:hypothetical protein